MTWRVQITEVGSRDGFSLHWSLVATTGNERHLISATTSHDGRVMDLQAGCYYAGSTGDDDLDAIVTEKIGAAIRMHDVMRDLDKVRQPVGRRRRAA